MIIKNHHHRCNFIGRLYQLIITITKFIAIYLVLSMAWSFSVILFIVMLVILCWIYLIVKNTDIWKLNMSSTPLDKLKNGLHKVTGYVEAKEMMNAPLNGRLCVGYIHEIYDINADGEDVFPAVKSELFCKDFIVCADGHRVNVDAQQISFVMLSGDVEQVINNQKHIQQTLSAKEEIVVVGDVVSDINNTYKLINTAKNNTLTVMKSEDIPLLKAMEHKPQQLLNLGIFISAILVSLILMAGMMWHSDNQVIFFFDLNQILLGNFSRLFSHELSFSFTFPTFLLPLIHANKLLLAALTTIGSYVIFYLLSKLNTILLNKQFKLLLHIMASLSLIMLIAGICSLFSAIILFIFSSDFIAIKLLMIWCTVTIFGVINIILFRLMERLG